MGFHEANPFDRFAFFREIRIVYYTLEQIWYIITEISNHKSFGTFNLCAAIYLAEYSVLLKMSSR